jgi:hypothetical protein
VLDAGGGGFVDQAALDGEGESLAAGRAADHGEVVVEDGYERGPVGEGGGEYLVVAVGDESAAAVFEAFPLCANEVGSVAWVRRVPMLVGRSSILRGLRAARRRDAGR